MAGKKLKTRELFDVRRTPEGTVYIPAVNGRAATKRKLSTFKLHSEVIVARTGGDGDQAFEACVIIGRTPNKGRYVNRSWTRGAKRASGYTTSCMQGRNPRAALKSALARAARQVGERAGAFAGGSGRES